MRRNSLPVPDMMKKHLLAGVLISAILIFCVTPARADVEFLGNATPPSEPLTLWYRRPAAKWVEALPIGNGRMGAMVFGGVDEEKLQLNEDTLWAGGPYDPVNPDAKEALPQAQQLIFEGKYREAAKLISAKIMSKPLSQMPYEPAGDLILSFPECASVENYRRDLNLDTATADVSYSANGVHFSRAVFTSPVDQVIVVHLTADKKGSISFVARLQTPQNASLSTEPSGSLVLRGVNGDSRGIKGALKFEVLARILKDGGKISTNSDSVAVTNADSATILIAMATSYRNYHDVSADPDAVIKATISAAVKKSPEALLNRHIQEHQRLFRRVSLDVGRTDAVQLPTDERIQNFHNGQDPQLAALYFQFGRYLLISSSHPGGQPANLQGLWNESMNPPWQSKYTININTEMNYWPAEPCNLGECVEPLIDMVRDLSETGARTAQEMYGASGWVAHHNTDLWRATGPIDGPEWGMWPTGGAWLCDHLWDHYEFSGDRKFLKEVYPVMRGAAQFFLDTLTEDPTNHWLVTNPSISPENQHPGGSAVCAGPSMDEEILRDLFANTIKASEILGTDEQLRTKLGAARARLAPLQIGSAGQLQEWLADWDMQAPEIHHRHVSHLYALYPSWQINTFDTPELVAAAKKSLEIRGDESTGWATAWRINLWDRLHEGDHAKRILDFLLSPQRTYPDMFDAHPPFQIDGNFGGAAGIAEMLLQSRALQTNGPTEKHEIELLPALPAAWPVGSVTGLRARGGFEIDVAWRDHEMTAVRIRSVGGRAATVWYNNRAKEIQLKPGDAVQLDSQLQRLGKQ